MPTKEQREAAKEMRKMAATGGFLEVEQREGPSPACEDPLERVLNEEITRLEFGSRYSSEVMILEKGVKEIHRMTPERLASCPKMYREMMIDLARKGIKDLESLVQENASLEARTITVEPKLLRNKNDNES